MNRITHFFLRKPKGSNPELAKEIKSITGINTKDIVLYETAFTHKSAMIKSDHGQHISYERLEFLGDAILGSIIAEYIYNEVPSGDEGYLTKMRSKIVSREHLNELGQDFKLVECMTTKSPANQLGKNIHGNLFEALVGAVYLDRGYSLCKEFIHQKVINPYVDLAQLEGKVISYKSLLIEWCQKNKKRFDFDTYEDTGVNELKHYSVKLHLDNKVVAKARATSKKKAEEKASKRAYFAIQHKM